MDGRGHQGGAVLVSFKDILEIVPHGGIFLKFLY
jgi:hypothetical protein